MTVANGRRVLATPGPTTLPDAVLSAMHRQPIDLYGEEMDALSRSCLADLKVLFGTQGHTYIYAANGHGAWEAALTNTLSRGDLALVLESGRFAVGWGEQARATGLDVEVLKERPRRAVDPAALEARLKADTAHRIKAILVVQVDTASSVVNDIAALRAAIDAANHPALFMVDCIASFGTMPYRMDAWAVDVTVTGSQKGLMLPPGLGFVAAGSRALAAHRSAGLVTRFWDWTFRDGPENYMKHCGTAPEHLIFGLRASLDMIAAEGFDAIVRRHALLAEATRRAVEAWARGGALELNILEASERSNAVTTVRTAFEAQGLIDWCERECGVTLGIAIGDVAGRGFRIAHMGHVNAPQILGVLACVEAGLRALGIPGEGGVDAATRYLGDTIRGA
jgi:alanine-glyoxylate transaminase/serine-glyoxylate transaminase/serine-pyruvate transaminase